MSRDRQKNKPFEQNLFTSDQMTLTEISEELESDVSVSSEDLDIVVEDDSTVIEISKSLSEVESNSPRLFLEKKKNGRKPKIISRSHDPVIRALSDKICPFNETDSEAAILSIQYFGEFCYCKKRLVQKVDNGWKVFSDSQLDHISPASAGHIVAKGNVRYLCKNCNENLKNGYSYFVYFDNLKEAGIEVDKIAELRKIQKFQEIYFKKFPEFKKFKNTTEHFDSHGKRIRLYEDRTYFKMVYDTLMDLKDEGRLISISERQKLVVVRERDDFDEILDRYVSSSDRDRGYRLRKTYMRVTGKNSPVSDDLTELEQIRVVYFSLYEDDRSERGFGKTKSCLRGLGEHENFPVVKEIMDQFYDKGFAFASFHTNDVRREKVTEIFESFGYSESEIKNL